MTYIYSYRNKKVPAFMDPFCSMIPEDGMVTSVIRTCKLQKKEAKAAHLDECDLYLLATFDDQTGKISQEEPKFLIALDQFFVEEAKDE